MFLTEAVLKWGISIQGTQKCITSEQVGVLLSLRFMDSLHQNLTQANSPQIQPMLLPFIILLYLKQLETLSSDKHKFQKGIQRSVCIITWFWKSQRTEIGFPLEQKDLWAIWTGVWPPDYNEKLSLSIPQFLDYTYNHLSSFEHKDIQKFYKEEFGGRLQR